MVLFGFDLAPAFQSRFENFYCSRLAALEPSQSGVNFFNSNSTELCSSSLHCWKERDASVGKRVDCGQTREGARV
jgi:hypothetical protein